MARCSGGALCNCKINGARGVRVTGAGTPTNPYTIIGEASGNLTVRDTATIDLTLTGSGTDTDAYVLAADATMRLGDLENVTTLGASNGQLLGWNAQQQQWLPTDPSQATIGSVVTGNCLQGAGTTGDPLTVDLAVGGGLRCTPDGLRLDAPFYSNTLTVMALSYADADQHMPPSRQDFVAMPQGVHEFTAPDWARSAIVDLTVQNLYCTVGNWAGTVGRAMVAQGGEQHTNAALGGDGGFLMWSTRPGSVRGSSVGYRDVLLLSGVRGGQSVTVHSQCRMTHDGGSGTMSAFKANTLMQTLLTWSDQ